MIIAIIGFGTQGKKRFKLLKKKNIDLLIVDPFYKNADAKNIADVKKPYSHAFICTPDNVKLNIIKFLIKKNIKILVEKPFYLKSILEYSKIKKLLLQHKKSFLYVAYNHRFEPNIIRMRKYLEKKILGKVFLVQMHYGNGTSMLWKNSSWRSGEKKGVIYDLAPHLLDIYLFLFNKLPKKNEIFIKSKNENVNIDYAQFGSIEKNYVTNFTTSLIDWRNKFEINIIAQNGSLHINSLCKWSDSIFTYRKRIMPSGVPKEIIFIEKKNDPTWDLEHNFFLNNSISKKSNFNNDLIIKNYIDKLFHEN